MHELRGGLAILILVLSVTTFFTSTPSFFFMVKVLALASMESARALNGIGFASPGTLATASLAESAAFTAVVFFLSRHGNTGKGEGEGSDGEEGEYWFHGIWFFWMWVHGSRAATFEATLAGCDGGKSGDSAVEAICESAARPFTASDAKPPYFGLGTICTSAISQSPRYCVSANLNSRMASVVVSRLLDALSPEVDGEGLLDVLPVVAAGEG